MNSALLIKNQESDSVLLSEVFSTSQICYALVCLLCQMLTDAGLRFLALNTTNEKKNTIILLLGCSFPCDCLFLISNVLAAHFLTITSLWSAVWAAQFFLLPFLNQQCAGCLISPVTSFCSAAYGLLGFFCCLSSISSVWAAWFLLLPLFDQQRAGCSVSRDRFFSIRSMRAALFLMIVSPWLKACGLLCFLQSRALIRNMLTACFLAIIPSRSAAGFFVIVPFLDQQHPVL